MSHRTVRRSIPSKIENLFKMEPVVNQIVLIGDKQAYVTALVTVNIPNVLALEGGEELKGEDSVTVLRRRWSRNMSRRPWTG